MATKDKPSASHSVDNISQCLIMNNYINPSLVDKGSLHIKNTAQTVVNHSEQCK